MKKLTFLLVFLMLSLCFVLPLAADEIPATALCVYDDADLFSAEEETRLRLVPCDGEVAYFIVTSDTAMSKQQVEKRCGIMDLAAIVLVIEPGEQTYYYEMFTFNDAYKMVSDADAVLDDPTLRQAIKEDADLAGGSERFFALCANQMQAWRRQRVWLCLLIAVIVALLAGGASALGVFLNYRKKRHGVSYPLSKYATLHLTESHDVFTGSHVTRVRVQSNSSSGGGGGGGSRGAYGGSRGRR